MVLKVSRMDFLKGCHLLGFIMTAHGFYDIILIFAPLVHGCTTTEYSQITIDEINSCITS